MKYPDPTSAIELTRLLQNDKPVLGDISENQLPQEVTNKSHLNYSTISLLVLIGLVTFLAYRYHQEQKKKRREEFHINS